MFLSNNTQLEFIYLHLLFYLHWTKKVKVDIETKVTQNSNINNPILLSQSTNEMNNA